MKKLIIALALAGAVFTTSAATYQEAPFINGWNLYVSNGVPAVTGYTNLLYTYIHGEIFYSLTNNMGNTNTIAPDAFASNVPLVADLNGDIVANATIHYWFGATNVIPTAITNSQGQYFVFVGNTNGLPSQTFPSTGWPLVNSKYPSYMYPATTNIYPAIALSGASATNDVTFNVQRGWNVGTVAYPYYVWDSATNSFTFRITGTGIVSGSTNIPTSWAQGANVIRLHSVINSGTNPIVVNQLSLGQPKP